MLVEKSPAERFGEIFPHIESVLRCGFFTHSIENNSSYWSEGVYRILGLDETSIVPAIENFVAYVSAPDRERVLRSVLEAREKRRPFSIEFSITDEKGKSKRIHAENFFKEHGNEGIYEGVVRDITETYNFRLALEQKVKQLDKSNQNLQEFVYIASHDLQEPLRKISTFTGRLQARFSSQLGEEGEVYIDRVLKSTRNMQVLLEDLLSFSRLSFADKPYEKVNLNDCFNSVLSDLEMKIDETGTKIIRDELPEIDGYYTQLKQ